MKGLKKILSAVTSLVLITAASAGFAAPASASVVMTTAQEQMMEVPCGSIKRTAGEASAPSTKNQYWSVSTGETARLLLGTVETGKPIRVRVNIYSKSAIPVMVYVCEKGAASENVFLEEGEYVCAAEGTIKGDKIDLTFDIDGSLLENGEGYDIYFLMDNTGSTAARIYNAALVYGEETTIESDSAQIAEGVTVTEMKLEEYPGTVGFVTNITGGRTCSKIHYQLKADGKQAQTRSYDLSVLDEASEADVILGIVVENVPEGIDIKCSATAE